jgi:pimeloyl-ACP methyl ester carboxylesterase
MTTVDSRARGGIVRLIVIVLAVAGMPILGLFFLLRSATQVPVSRGAPDPGDVLLDAEDVALIAADGVRLSAWSIRGRPGSPPIILVHDLGGSKGDLLNAAATLNRAGYGLLLLDLRRHGGSAPAMTTLGAKERLDVLAAVRFLKDRPGPRAERIGGWGVGMGAYALAVAALEAPELQVVALDSLYSDVPTETDRLLTGRLPPPFTALVPVARLLYDPFFRCRLEDVSLRRRIQALAGKDLLIIAPSESPDRLAEARLLYEAVPEAADGGRSLLVLGRSGLAGLYGEDRMRYDQAIAEFFTGALPVEGGGSPPTGPIEVIER